MSNTHTRATDEQLLIQFVDDQGCDSPDIVEAAKRLKECIKQGWQDYGVHTSDDV